MWLLIWNSVAMTKIILKLWSLEIWNHGHFLLGLSAKVALEEKKYYKKTIRNKNAQIDLFILLLKRTQLKTIIFSPNYYVKTWEQFLASGLGPFSHH